MHTPCTFKQMTPQLTPSNWTQLFSCTTLYPSRTMLSLPIWSLLSLKYLLSAIQMHNSVHWLDTNFNAVKAPLTALEGPKGSKK